MELLIAKQLRTESILFAKYNYKLNVAVSLIYDQINQNNILSSILSEINYQ